MTDNLARIRAEQDADVALEGAHPDPLSIAGELQARAADRCARKRVLWGTRRYHAITCEDPCGGYCDCWCHRCWAPIESESRTKSEQKGEVTSALVQGG